MAKRALISGITGQDGSYLAELLLDRDYEVFGFDRRVGPKDTRHIARILGDITLIEADLTDEAGMADIVVESAPDEVYNLASQSFVPLSFEEPVMTTEVNALGVVRLLEAVRKRAGGSGGGRGGGGTGGDAPAGPRFFQASTGEMFGRASHFPQDESTDFDPMSPYAVSKLFAYHVVRSYRESYGMHACNGILFNHESPRRPEQFVTRKITRTVARIKHGLEGELRLGNLDARRDWGFAGDYVRAMWLMLQHEEPGDYVVATGQEHTVRDFVSVAFAHVGLDWQDHVVIDPEFYRPLEVWRLVGDPSKARSVLGWQPEVSFDELVAMMVDADMELAASEAGG